MREAPIRMPWPSEASSPRRDEQLPVVLGILREAEARIEDDLVRVDPGDDELGDA